MTTPRAYTAVSLRRLQERLGRWVRCPGTRARALGGLTTIAGFAVDDELNDVILYGRAERRMPRLNVDDLVIALRSAFRKYTHREGNTIYFTPLGCSIDPRPATMRDLEQVGNALGNADSAGDPHLLRQWRSCCEQPQDVRLLGGLPWGSHMARVLVDSDYLAKRVLDGTKRIPGVMLDSMADLQKRRAETDFHRGSRPAGRGDSTNRFEFVQGELSVAKDPSGVVRLSGCPVRLLTEAEQVSRQGRTSGLGRPNPMAAEAARQFTEQLPAIARHVPVYAELLEMFRWMVLAQLLHDDGVQDSSGLSLGYLLDRHRVRRGRQPRTLPGRSCVTSFEASKAFPGGTQSATWWFPSCGGVSLEVDASRLRPEYDRGLLALGKRMVTDRPHRRARWWAVPRLELRQQPLTRIGAVLAWFRDRLASTVVQGVLVSLIQGPLAFRVAAAVGVALLVGFAFNFTVNWTFGTFWQQVASVVSTAAFGGGGGGAAGLWLGTPVGMVVVTALAALAGAAGGGMAGSLLAILLVWLLGGLTDAAVMELTLDPAQDALGRLGERVHPYVRIIEQPASWLAAALTGWGAGWFVSWTAQGLMDRFPGVRRPIAALVVGSLGVVAVVLADSVIAKATGDVDWLMQVIEYAARQLQP